jgi:hypothetical protein
MTASANQWRCDGCQHRFENGGDPILARCPACDSDRLTRSITVHEELRTSVSEHVILKCKDPSLPSKRKLRRELRSGRRLEGSGSALLVDEHRLVDANHDVYEERIVDVESGSVLREISDLLSKHRGGSQKS